MLTLHEYSQHRRSRGLPHSRSGILKAIRQGRLTSAHRDERGQYFIPDADAADAEWASAGGRVPSPPTSGESPASGKAAADARRALAQAELAELQVARERGELVAMADVEALLFTAARQSRDAILAVPARVVPAIPGLAPEQAAGAVDLLGAELTRALEGLSADLAAGAGR